MSAETKRWRDHARELRAIAAGTKDATAKRHLIKIADDWELLADRQDERDAPKPKRPTRRK